MWFRPYVAICGHFSSLRFKKSIIEKLNNCSFVVYVNIELFSHVYDARRTACLISIAFLDILYNYFILHETLGKYYLQHVVNDLKNDSSYALIGEVILKINVV
jgi:hypothetical protein